MLDVGDVLQRFELDFPAVRAGGQANDLGHQARFARDCGADGGSAAGEGLIGIGEAGVVSGCALGVAEFHRAGLEVELALDDGGQRVGGPGEHRVPEGVEACLVGTDLFAGFVLHTLAADDDAVLVLGDHFLHPIEESGFIQRNFRQHDDVRWVGGIALLGQDGSGSDPAGGPAHDFDDAAGAVIGGHGTDIEADFHHGGRVVLDHRAVSRAVVGGRQVVVDGLGHTHHAHVITALHRLQMDFVSGILGIVAARVEKIADVVGGEDLEKTVHVLSRLFGLLLEIDLVAAGAESRRRRVP